MKGNIFAMKPSWIGSTKFGVDDFNQIENHYYESAQ